MSLTPGSRLGPYEVTALIGSGGMGEVYRARDTKLDRNVALKVLPDLSADDPERLARFQREAKVLASLNHPNIAGIYGLEEADGVRALVLELVEGPTLADRIAQGPIPLDEALPIARQMAEALEAAHEAGVIHRDLKPANVKVKDDGTVKVLDFGLAKALAGDVGGDPLQSPTMTAATTKMGVIMGTAAYMSPEQAKGKVVDRRADVWAFGAVLYEMLTGQRAFAGGNVSDTLATVLKSDPAWQALPAETPPAIKRLLHRCLEKDPRLRLRESGTAIVEIHEAQTTPFAPTVEVGAAPQPVGWRRAVPWVTGIVLALITGFAGWNLKPPEPRPVSRFAYDLPESHQFSNSAWPALAVSADGSQFVYSTTKGLYLRSMGEVNARLIPGTEENLAVPFFSPDGQSIGYVSIADGQLKRLAVSGGAPVTLTDALVVFGASWGLDDTIVYGQPDGIWRVSANGGAPVRIVATEENQSAAGPQVLPGGAWVLFTLAIGTGADRWDEAQIVVQSLESDERKVLIEGDADARYVPTGHLVYALGNVLYAIAFDADSLTVSGGPVPVVQGVRRAPAGTTGLADFSFSNQGSLVYVSGAPLPNDRTLALVDRNGVVEPLSVPPAQYLTPRLSPDGEKLVVQTAEDEGSVLWIYDLSADTQIQQLTFEGDNHRPVWTPDSQRVTFSSDRDGTMSLYWMPVDGSEVPERLTTAEDGTSHWLGSWSPDGQTLLFNVQRDLVTDWDIWTLSGNGRETQSLYDTPGTIYLGAELSPDGQWLAYGAGPTAPAVDIYVDPFPPTGSRRRISQDGGYWPLWSRDGHELFYRSVATGAGITLRSVDVVTEPDFAFSNEQTLPIDGFIVVSTYRDYDITPDDERLVMVFPADQTEGGKSSRPQINIVLNWHQELLDRVSVP